MIDEPLVGVRLWMLHKPPYTATKTLQPIPGLRATNATYVWTPGVNEARCNTYRPCVYAAIHPPMPYGMRYGCQHPRGELVPGKGCVCGMHAFHSHYDLETFFGQSSLKRLRPAGIFGIVRGWGRVQLHPDGWRSQFAEIMALIPGLSGEGIDHSHFEPLSQIYGVPLLSAEAYPNILGEFGTIAPLELRPQSGEA